MRIQTAVGIHAGIQQQANVVPMGEDAVQESPAHFAELLFALGVPEKVLAVLADGNVRVHAAAVHSHHWFRQERCRQPHVGRNLAADQLVKLNLVGGGHDFAVSIVDFEL